LELYNNASYADLVLIQNGKKVFFIPDNPGLKPDPSIIKQLQSNGGRNDVVVVKMWADFADSGYSQGTWGFFSPCRCVCCGVLSRGRGVLGHAGLQAVCAMETMVVGVRIRMALMVLLLLCVLRACVWVGAQRCLWNVQYERGQPDEVQPGRDQQQPIGYVAAPPRFVHNSNGNPTCHVCTTRHTNT